MPAYAHVLVAMLLVYDAHRALAGVANQHHIADVDLALLLGNAALHVFLRILADGLLHHHHVLNQHRALGRRHTQHAAFFALVAPADDPDLIVTTNIYNLVHVDKTFLAFSS